MFGRATIRLGIERLLTQVFATTSKIALLHENLECL